MCTRSVVATVVILAVAGRAMAEDRYDLRAVTSLAAGAVTGQNVNSPVPGFELLLLKDGRPVYHRAFGAWSVGRVANADSATKTFSGALVMSVTEQSATPFLLDSRLSDFIPQFDGLMTPITIRQCFSHTAGFGNSAALNSTTLTLQQVAQSIAGGTLRYLPGTTFSYGGTSMQAAGAVAELAGGAPWNSLFSQRIAGPLGLFQTRYVLSSPSNPRIAGGIESTATEFGTFMEMLRRGGVHEGPAGAVRVLRAASVQAMLTRQTPVGVPIANSPIDTPYTDNADYGVGIWLDDRDPQGNLRGAIAAGARGFSSWLDLDDGLVGVFATDLTTSGNIQPLLYMIRTATEQAVRNPYCAADFNFDHTVDPDDLADFIGCYFSSAPCAEADFNVDTQVDPDDFADFIRAYFGGCEL